METGEGCNLEHPAIFPASGADSGLPHATFLTLFTAADILGVPCFAVRHAAKRGLFPSYNFGMACHGIVSANPALP